MTQRELIFRARKTDPETSHLAAMEIEKRNIPHRQAGEVLAALRIYPDSTTRELAGKSGLDRYQCGRRMSELEKRKLVEKTGTRVCIYSGKKAITWKAV